jgi:hypothetical protein
MNEDAPRTHVYGPIEPVLQPVKKSLVKTFFSWLWGFIKKHKLAIGIIIVIAAICAVLFVTLPVVAIGQYKFVNDDTSVKIELGQTAKLKYADVTVKINKFISNICPTGETCYGSGPVVDYNFTIDGQKYVDTSLTPNVPVYRYQIKTIKTDNKTYAEIKIVKS